MIAWTLAAPGDTSNLKFTELPLPVLTESEVLVAIHSISINPIDAKTRSGKGLYPALLQESPLILGWDMSGIVVQTGSRVSKFKTGDSVFGMVNFPGHGRCYAAYVAAPEDQLAVVPPGLSHHKAAAASLAALTAWQAMHQFAPIKKNNRVLIHAAAGGVGHFAVQIAKYLGAWVAGTASAVNRDLVLSLGADQHIDYQAAPLHEQISDIDFVLDTLGGPTIDQSLQVMNKGATIVSIPSGLNESVSEKAAAMGMQGFRFLVKSNGNDMQAIAGLLQQEILRPFISEVYPFNDIAKAHAQIETGRTRGKLVVTMEY